MNDEYTIEGTFNLECRCGERLRISMHYPVQLRDLNDEADRLAEMEGWGDRATCGDCQRKLDRDVAEVNAADARNEALALGL